MVIRVLGHLGMPDHFLGEKGLAVHHRANLAVASARVKADAAAIQVLADGAGAFLGRLNAGRVFRVFHL